MVMICRTSATRTMMAMAFRRHLKMQTATVILVMTIPIMTVFLITSTLMTTTMASSPSKKVALATSMTMAFLTTVIRTATMLLACRMVRATRTVMGSVTVRNVVPALCVRTPMAMVRQITCRYRMPNRPLSWWRISYRAKVK